MSLQLKLIAAVLCLAGAAAGTITLAGVAVLRGYLMRQADQQLGAAADSLARRATVAWPGQRDVLGDPGRLRIELFTPGGQLLMALGQGAGPAVPVSPAWAAAHAGRPVTVPGRDGGQSWRIIAEPVHYQAHHIMYVYAADDISLVLTGRAGPGAPATLVVGMGLAGIGQAAGRLAIASVAISIVMILAAAGIGAVVIRASLRPLAEIQRTAGAAGRDGWPRPAGAGEPGGEFGSLARSVNTILSRAGDTLRAQAAVESAARQDRERMSRVLTDALQELREPVNVVTGFAAYYRQHDGRGAGEPGPVMRRVADETARMGATLDALGAAAAPSNTSADGRPPTARAEACGPAAAGSGELETRAAGQSRPCSSA